MGSSSALCRKRSTPCILLACALAVSLDISSVQSFLVGSAVYKPLSVLCRRGEECMLRNSAKGAPGETISLDANRDVAGRHLEQWFLAQGREADETTVQALRDVPPELALTIIDGLWSAFTKKHGQEDVDASSLAVGQRFPGIIHFGGASMNLGEALQLHIPALDLEASATIGQDQKMHVQVGEIQGDWKRDVQVEEIQGDGAPALSVDVDAIRLGQQLRGVVTALPDFGGAFLSIGAHLDVYLPAAVLPEDTQVGDEMDVWVSGIKADGKVTVTPTAPKLDISSLALGQKLHGVIVHLPEFGGAFLDIGAVVNVYIPAVDLADGAKVGDEMDVWVKDVKADGKVVVTPTAPKLDISSLALGQKLHGVIVRLPKFGGAFMDVGAVVDTYILAVDLADGAKVGDEIDVWVTKIDDGKVYATPKAPKLDISSVAVGDKLHGVIKPLPKFGGAFVDIGAVTDAYIPASDLTEDVKAGAEVDVWVKRIGDGGRVQVTQQAPEPHNS